MSSPNLAAIIIKAKSGNVDALVALIDAIARDLRAFIATYAASQIMVDDVHAATWIQVRRELNSCPSSTQAITWIRQRAITILQQQLDGECRTAIASRDGLLHLIAQDGIEGLQALISPSNEGAALINKRYAALDEASQILISRRYSDGATLSELASENHCGDGDIARRLFTARAGMHWRATANDQQPPDDPHVAIAIDQLLTHTLDAPSKLALNSTLMKDLSRAAAFARQARIDLMLRAIFAPYTQEDARQLAGNLAKIESKRRNESSLLHVAAPPRAPIGSGSELRINNEQVAHRKNDTPSSALVTNITMPISRANNARRTASGDRTLLTRERRSPTNNQQNLFIGIIGISVAVIGLIALIMVWSGGRNVTAIGAATAGNRTPDNSANETKNEPANDARKNFVRGINFGGPAVTIDRHTWLSHRDALSAGLTLEADTSIAPPLAIIDSTLDFDRKSMLNTGIISVNGGAIRMNQIMPNGTYGLSLWLANTHSLNEKNCSFSVNSIPINLSGVIAKHDHWALLGPLPIQITTGKMELFINGQGNARITGLELTAPTSDTVALPAAITLTSPVDAASFSAKDSITFRVAVSGTVTSVAIFDDKRRLGESTSKPYSVTVKSLPVGDHRITARATNPSGAISESLPLAFRVLPETSPGTITMERWDGITGNLISEALTQNKLTAPADATGVLTDFSSIQQGDNYYVRVRGYLLPPTTGEYVFFIASDDDGELFLSRDPSPNHAQSIAQCQYASGITDWNHQPSQQSKPVSLVAGQRYYVEMRYKNGGGAGYGVCGWKRPDGTLERPILGRYLSPLTP